MDCYDVFWENKPVGKVTATTMSGGVRFDAVCMLAGRPVLRLFGAREGRYLPIGVLAPHDGCWHIGRTLSRQTLSEYGFGDSLPKQFLLAEQMPQEAWTNDPLLDAALRSGMADLSRSDRALVISCPFEPTQPSPLSFALTACRVIQGRAVLELPV